MGLNPLWQEDVMLTVQDCYREASIFQTQPYFLVSCDGKVLLHLIPLGNDFTSDELIDLQQRFANKNQQVVHLWEDIWFSKRAQVLSRIKSFLGKNQSFHGRKAKLLILDGKETKKFLNENHLQGYVKAKYNLALVDGEKIIAVACFSEARPMPSRGMEYQSAELVRFASISGLTVVGGLSKLIKYFMKLNPVDDLMTYADRDWSLGKGYQNLGFEFVNITEPAFLYLNTADLIRYFPHRLPKALLADFEQQNDLNLENFLTLNGYVKIFNTGNLKYLLYR